MVEEATDEGVADLTEAAGALPPDGMQRRLEWELACARLEYARMELWGEEYCSEGCGSEGCEGGADGASLEGTDDGHGGVSVSVECQV